MSLLEEAKKQRRFKPNCKFTREQLELAVAWIEDEVSTSQVKAVVGRKYHQSVYNFLAQALQVAYNDGNWLQKSPDSLKAIGSALERHRQLLNIGEKALPGEARDNIPPTVEARMEWVDSAKAWLAHIVCPFCGNLHTHGGGNNIRYPDLGHRNAHCLDRDACKGGYILRHDPKKTWPNGVRSFDGPELQEVKVGFTG